MYNQTDNILAQYELEIEQITKGRGFLYCDTGRGRLLLCPFRGSKEKGEYLCEFLEQLKKNGYETEQVVRNKSGEAVTEDEVTGERFWLKSAIEGNELGTSRLGEIIEAAEMLAEYHNVASAVETVNQPPSRLDAMECCLRHTRELVKVRNFIRGKKRKQEFEEIYMRYFQRMYETAQKSCEILRESTGEAHYLMCHGDCNQHNILLTEHGFRLIHFENMAYCWSVWDLANYLRKMMEKNDWNVELGMEILKAYHQRRKLSREDYNRLCGLLLFPEKFWKVANHYMSSNKSWIPEKDIEKLRKVIEQEIHRLKFVENLFSIGEE